MKASKSIFLILAVIAVAATGCSGEKDIPLPETGTWKLSEIITTREIPSLEEPVTISLSLDGTTVSGFSGCNTYFTGYKLNENSIIFENIASTRRIGPEENMALENLFLDQLALTASYKNTKEGLTLFDSDGNEILRFVPYEITDIQWDLTSYLKTEVAVETVPEDVEAFITLSKDGKLNGNTGVNILNTTYSISDGNGIQIQPGATTMMAAPTEEIGNFEQRFLELLGSAVSYRLSGDTLTLVDANDSSLLIFSCKK